MKALNYYKTKNSNKNMINPVLLFVEIPKNAETYRDITMYKGFYIYQGVIISEYVRTKKEWVDIFFDGSRDNYHNVKRPLEALKKGLELIKQGLNHE